MALIQIYDPTAPGLARPAPIRRSLSDLTGAVVGFIDNSKPNFNFLADDIGAVLVAKYGVASVIKRAKEGASMPAPDEVIAEMADRCDVVVTGSGD